MSTAPASLGQAWASWALGFTASAVQLMDGHRYLGSEWSRRMAAQPLRMCKRGFLACFEELCGSISQPSPVLLAIPATTPMCVCVCPQGQLGEAHGEDGGQHREVLGRFCTLTASYTQKVANPRNEVDLLVKQHGDYANIESLAPQRALPGS